MLIKIIRLLRRIFRTNYTSDMDNTSSMKFRFRTRTDNSSEELSVFSVKTVINQNKAWFNLVLLLSVPLPTYNRARRLSIVQQQNRLKLISQAKELIAHVKMLGVCS